MALFIATLQARRRILTPTALGQISRLFSTLLPPDRRYTQAQREEVLHIHLPPYADRLRKNVKEAMAIASYRSQTTFPIVQLLVCDDTPQFTYLTEQLALCWVHEYRHDKKLIPRFLLYCRMLEQFAEDFWTFYHRLLAYRKAPSQAEANELRGAFQQGCLCQIVIHIICSIGDLSSCIELR